MLTLHARLRALTAALIACSTSAWAATSNVDVYGQLSVDTGAALPTHETYAAAANTPANYFVYDPAYTPPSSVATGSDGAAAAIGGSGYAASALTTLGSNRAYAQGSTFPSGTLGAASFSGWYDQVTISGGTGTGTAQFTVQLSGSVNVGAIAGVVGYGLLASGVHPSVLGTDVILDPGTPTSPWFLIASEVSPIIGYGIVASPYGNPSQISGLFGPPPSPGDGIPNITNLPTEIPPPSLQPDLLITPGVNQSVSVTLSGTLNFTYGEAFYLIGTLSANLLDLNAFQPFCSFDVECPANPPVDGTGPTILDFTNGARLVNITLPDGATASFASGASLNVTAVPEPGEWLMLLAGLGLVGWITRRRT